MRRRSYSPNVLKLCATAEEYRETRSQYLYDSLPQRREQITATLTGACAQQRVPTSVHLVVSVCSPIRLRCNCSHPAWMPIISMSHWGWNSFESTALYHLHRSEPRLVYLLHDDALTYLFRDKSESKKHEGTSEKSSMNLSRLFSTTASSLFNTSANCNIQVR